MTHPHELHREERLHALDNLRAAAMMLGIVLHSAASFITTPMPWIVQDPESSLGFDVLVGVIHGFRIQLFFFLAGFFGHLLWTRLGTRRFLVQRLARIGVPFVIGMATLVPLMFAITRWSESQVTANPTWDKSAPLTFLKIPTCHLWFLEMLLILYPAMIVLAKLVPAPLLARLDTAFDAMIGRPWKVLVPVVPTMLCLWHGPRLGDVEDFGMEMLPSARAVAYCGLFLAAGWWLHRRRHHLGTLQRWSKTNAILAVTSFATLGACHLLLMRGPGPGLIAVRVTGTMAAAIYAWAMIFFTTGAFLRFAGQHRPWIRYLADASYGCYLLHLPLVLWLQVAASKWPLPGVIKVALIIIGATGGSLLVHHFLLRDTRIGRLMLGRSGHR